MEIAYRLTASDVLEAYRIGQPRVTLRWKVFHCFLVVWFFLGLLVAMIAPGLPLRPGNVGAMGWRAFTFLICTLGGISTAIPICYLAMRAVQLTLTANRLVVKQWFGSSAFHWDSVSEIVDSGSHVCFCINTPLALVVPKAAFPCSEQAQAFLEHADHFWRRKTGRRDPPMPNPAEVWPPAPRPANSLEPDAAP